MKNTIGLFLGIIALILGISFLMAWPVMMLWNGCLVPAIAGVSEIGWLQAWGISVLSAMLFKTTTYQKGN